MAFRAVLKTAGSVTSANNAIVVAGGAIIARKGDIAPGTTSAFSVFENPAAGSAGNASFIATLAGASTATDNGLWEYRNSALGLVAREGDAAAEQGAGVTVKSIARFAQPGGNAGPIFVATLQGTGVTLTNNVVLYAVPVGGGAAKDLARTGDQFDIGGTMRTLRVIRALDIDLGSEGSARGYRGNSVFMIGTFNGLIDALIELPVVSNPE